MATYLLIYLLFTVATAGQIGRWSQLSQTRESALEDSRYQSPGFRTLSYWLTPQGTPIGTTVYPNIDLGINVKDTLCTDDMICIASVRKNSNVMLLILFLKKYWVYMKISWNIYETFIKKSQIDYWHTFYLSQNADSVYQELFNPSSSFILMVDVIAKIGARSQGPGPSIILGPHYSTLDQRASVKAIKWPGPWLVKNTYRRHNIGRTLRYSLHLSHTLSLSKITNMSSSQNNIIAHIKNCLTMSGT